MLTNLLEQAQLPWLQWELGPVTVDEVSASADNDNVDEI